MAAVNIALTFPHKALVRLSAAFTRPPTTAEITDGTASDADDWQPVDPDAVTCMTKLPSGSPQVVSYVYGVDAQLTRDDVGLYHLDLTADPSGSWSYRFEGTGGGQAAAEASFKVAESVFA